MKRRSSSRGFSLLELLIVVAIILIIATIAIPSLLRSRQTAHEAAAVGTLNTLNTAMISYTTSSGGVYSDLPALAVAGLIDTRFSTVSPISGYNYTVDLAVNRRNYTIYASANSSNEGRYDYYTGPDYVIRFATDSTRSPAGLNGAPVN